MSNEKQVRKGWRSLPKRFESKVTIIEEALDLTNMRLDDLIGNLTTFEMKFDSTECPNYVKKQTKSYYATHSDEDSNEDEGSDNVNNFVAFTTQVSREGYVNPSTSHIQSGNITDDEEDLTEEELIANYQLLFHKWSKLTQVYTIVEVERK
ncbi:hypothetical protein LIER_24133 [Lithospermum erythrorhizon]|uniref:Uncharacterized protein n=1 Tax=Lithospermum erythrorhizon TaxID=34254 RepID=A0AAV3R486_LITER